MSEAAKKTSLTKEVLFEWLQPCIDPELNFSLVDLGLIYEADYNEEKKSVHVKMTLTSPGCPAGDFILDEIKKRLLEHEAIETAEVEIVWEPKWNPQDFASDEIKEKLGLW